MSITLSAGASTLTALMLRDHAADHAQTPPPPGTAPTPTPRPDHVVTAIPRDCERAVVIAYQDLRTLGTDPTSAFHACANLYRIHHPESSTQEATHLVSIWIEHHLIRAASTPTPGCDCP
jgi:hypothetical protein